MREKKGVGNLEGTNFQVAAIFVPEGGRTSVESMG